MKKNIKLINLIIIFLALLLNESKANLTNKIIEIADSLGVEQNNIITDKFSIRPVERWIEKKDEYGGTYNSPEIIAYEVSNQIRITIEGEDKETIIPDLIDKSAIETQDFFRSFNVEFMVKDLEDSLIKLLKMH